MIQREGMYRKRLKKLTQHRLTRNESKKLETKQKLDFALKRRQENDEIMKSQRKMDSTNRNLRRALAEKKRREMFSKKKEELSLSNNLYDQRKSRVLHKRDIYLDQSIGHRKARIGKRSLPFFEYFCIFSLFLEEKNERLKNHLNFFFENRKSMMEQRISNHRDKKRSSYIKRQELDEKNKGWQQSVNHSLQERLKTAKSYRDAKRKERRFELVLKNKQKMEEQKKKRELELQVKVIITLQFLCFAERVQEN